MAKYEMLTVLNIQVVPHVTDEIKQWIQSVSSVSVDGQTRPADVCVIELGGTVGRVL
jgi:CTP synthase